MVVAEQMLAYMRAVKFFILMQIGYTVQKLLSVLSTRN